MIPGAEVGVGQHTVAMAIKDDRGPFVVTDKFCVLTIVGTLQFMILCLSFSQDLASGENQGCVLEISPLYFLTTAYEYTCFKSSIRVQSVAQWFNVHL